MLYYKCPLCKSDYKKDLIDKYILLVKYNGLELKHIQNQTEEICKIAVKQNGYALEYVQKQTDEICKIAIQEDLYSLRYVQNQTEELCKFAVQKNGCVLEYVNIVTDELCIMALLQAEGMSYYPRCEIVIKKNPYALRFIENQTFDICKLAVKQNITVTTVNGTATMADAGFSADNATFGGALNPGIIQLRNVNNNDIFQFAASSSAMYNGGGQWPGPQIATYQNDIGDATIIGFQTDTTWTDGRVTILRPLIAQSGSVVSGSLLVSGSSTLIGNQTISGSLRMSGSVNFATGSNKQAGTATLDGGNPGTVTVSNSLVTANSIIMVSKQTLNHTNGYVAVSAKSAGSFTITSNHNGDTDTVGWFIINNS
jgi:hypothetical protein